MALLEGMYVAGKCEGFESTPWRNDPNKYNHRIGISREFTGQFGAVEKKIEVIDVPQDFVSKFQAQAQQLKGQQVIIRVVAQARAGGRNGAFLSLFAPADSDLLPQARPQAVAKQAS